MLISKIIKIVFCLLVIICSLSFVSAGGNDTSDIEEIDNEIAPIDETVILTSDYLCCDDEFNVTKNITVEGNNHTVLANDSESILRINVSDSCNLILRDINFNVPLELTFNSSNITLINCNMNVSTNKPMELYFEGNSFGKSGNISEAIFIQAKSAVGKYKDLRAIKQLAYWVARNVNHETRNGFYQSPEDTLNRRKGNCCCQSLLFLQMCESLGLLNGHKAYFIHVGLEMFGKRHFFVMIDNLCIDVDVYTANPWGHALFSNRTVFVTTEYPTLPLEFNY